MCRWAAVAVQYPEPMSKVVRVRTCCNPAKTDQQLYQLYATTFTKKDTKHVQKTYTPNLPNKYPSSIRYIYSNIYKIFEIPSGGGAAPLGPARRHRPARDRRRGRPGRGGPAAWYFVYIEQFGYIWTYLGYIMHIFLE